MPCFWRLVIKLSYKVQTNPFRMCIWMQKSIEFQLPPYKIPQVWSYYVVFITMTKFCRSSKITFLKIIFFIESQSIFTCLTKFRKWRFRRSSIWSYSGKKSSSSQNSSLICESSAKTNRQIWKNGSKKSHTWTWS